MLSDVKKLKKELLVFGNQEKIKIECIGNLGDIKNVRVLPNVKNIIVSMPGLKLLG